MQQGMAYDYLSDPTGGHRMYENPMLSWGMIGVDLGLTMGHGWISKGMTKSHTAHLKARSKSMSYAEKSAQFGKGMGPHDPGRLERSSRRFFKKEINKLGPKYQKFGKHLRGIGWFAAIAGLADLGFSVASAMARPGVSREAQERDREMLSNSEGMLDTRMAFTQRQRAIQAIHDSQISVGRSMIGQESSYLHR